jgi:hypothetical protein
MRRFLTFSIILFSGYYAFGQAQQQGPTCAQTLRLARATYEQGRLQEIEQQLKPCIDNGFTKQEKVEAYKLLCLSYIYLEEPEKADEAMLYLLRTDPYFEINDAVDPAEFVALWGTFRSWPIYRIGVKLGANASQPNVSETITAVDFASGSGYKFLVGFQFGATADLPLHFISKKLVLHADLMYQSKRFEMTLKVNRGTDGNGNMLTNTFTGTEAQNWISLPITIEYELFDKKYHPYIALGGSVDYLLGSTITSDRLREQQASIEPKSFDPLREKLNFSAIAAAGVKVPLSAGFVVLEVRYVYGLTNITTQESAFSNAQYTLDYGYADSIFKINSLSVTGSYIINIFNPKKLNRK